MGENPSETSASSRWSKIILLLEPQLVDSSGNDVSRFLDISSEGDATYEPKADAAAKLTKSLRKLWAERGDASKITVEALQREEEEEKRRAEAADGMDVEEEKSKDEHRGGDDEEEGMTPADLMTLKIMVSNQLEEARNQMLRSHVLLSLLIANPNAARPPGNSAPPAPNALIEGFPTMAATHVTPVPPTPVQQSHSLKLSMGAKNASLRSAAGLFMKAANEAENALKAEGQYFAKALALRDQWRLSPKGTVGKVRLNRKAAREPARDFVIYYGMEGSTLQHRLANVAHLSPQSINPTLVFPSRTHLRLSVTLKSLRPCQLSHLAGSSKFDPPETTPDSDLQLREVQREVLDREIFDRLMIEMTELAHLSPTIRERYVSLRPTNDLELSFELIDASSPPPVSAQPSPPMTVLCWLLPILHLPRTRPSLLKPIVQTFQYLDFCSMLSGKLETIIDGVTASGINLSMQQRLVTADGEDVFKALLGEDEWAIGGEVKIALEGCIPIVLSVRYPAQLTLLGSRSAFSITSLAELGEYVGKEIVSRLTTWLERIGRRLLRSHQGGSISSSEGEWLIALGKGWAQWSDGAVGYDISIDESTYAVSAVAVFSWRSRPSEQAQTPSTPGTAKPETLRLEYEPQDMSLGEWFESAMRNVIAKGDDADEEL